MKTIKGPGIFLAQFLDDKAPFNTLEGICKWAAGLGFKGVQITTWDPRMIDLKKAAESKTYADEIKGIVQSAGMEITELSTHLQGQLVAVHPAYNELFDGFAPKELHGNAKARTEWAVDQLKYAAKASRNLGLNAHATFSGALLWHTVYPWPQRPAGLVETGFKELAARWLPILNEMDANGVDLCYEIHPGKDLPQRRQLRTVPRSDRQSPARMPPLRSKSLRIAMPGLPGVHRYLSREDKDVPCEGRRIQSHRPFRRVRRIPGLDRPPRPFPFTRRWAGGLFSSVQQADAIQLCRLGRDGMGIS